VSVFAGFFISHR
jgi:hypothetical protein